jgi:hypothetical protein
MEVIVFGGGEGSGSVPLQRGSRVTHRFAYRPGTDGEV